MLALHPIYVNIAALGPFSDKLAATHEALFKTLNSDATAPLDYEAVMDAKLRLLRLVFEEKGAETMASSGYAEWFSANEKWLRPYALYCLFRDLQVGWVCCPTRARGQKGVGLTCACVCVCVCVVCNHAGCG